MPAELIGGAIAYARSEPGIESIPGWVVEALRRHRDEGWPIPPPRTRQRGPTSHDRPIDIEHYTNGAYGDLFRLGSDTTGLDERSLDPQEAQPAQVPHQPLVQPGQPIDAHGAAEAGTGDRTGAPKDAPDRAGADLTHQVRERLLAQCEGRHRPLVERLRVQLAGDVALVCCASLADRAVVEEQLRGALRCILAELGAPAMICVTDQAGAGTAGAPGEEAREHAALRQPGSNPEIPSRAVGCA
jgi:hypothetical protein